VPEAGFEPATGLSDSPGLAEHYWCSGSPGLKPVHPQEPFAKGPTTFKRAVASTLPPGKRQSHVLQALSITLLRHILLIDQRYSFTGIQHNLLVDLLVEVRPLTHQDGVMGPG